MCKLLLDAYKECGNSYEEFVEKITAFSDATCIKKGYPAMFDILSSCKIPNINKPGSSLFYLITEENINAFKDEGKFPKLVAVKRDDNDVLMDETNNTSQLMLRDKNEIYEDTKYFVSEGAITSLLKQIGLGGSFAGNNSSIIRNMLIAEACYVQKDNQDQIAYIVRKEEGKEKIFAVMGRYFSYTPQSFLVDIVDYLLEINATIKSWEITHQLVTVKMMFPELKISIDGESIIPGIIIKNSDMGESSFRLQLVLYTKEDYVICDEETRKHTSVLNVEDIFEQINNLMNKIDNISSIWQILKQEYINSPNDQMNLFCVMNNINFTNFLANIENSVFGFLPRKRAGEISKGLREYLNSTEVLTFADALIGFYSISFSSTKDANEVTLEDLRKNNGQLLYRFEREIKSINEL